jgi:hypothetical protein
MLKKKNLFFTFIILCFIIFISLNNIFKNYNYSIILVKFDRNVDRHVINNTWFNFFFDEIDKIGIDKKLSQYVIFDNLQKWNIKDNLIMYENVNDTNKKNIENLIGKSLNLEENEFFLMLYFSLNKKELTKTLEKLKKYLDLAQIKMKEKCLDLNKKYKDLKNLNDQLDNSNKYKIFFEEYYKNRLINIKNIEEGYCLENSYTFIENKKVKKYNIPILSIIISLFIVLSIFFISNLYDVYKKR